MGPQKSCHPEGGVCLGRLNDVDRSLSNVFKSIHYQTGVPGLEALWLWSCSSRGLPVRPPHSGHSQFSYLLPNPFRIIARARFVNSGAAPRRLLRPCSSSVSPDFNESDRCKAIWWKPVSSFSSLQPGRFFTRCRLIVNDKPDKPYSSFSILFVFFFFCL